MSYAVRNTERQNEGIRQFFQPGMQRVKQAVVEADKRNTQFQKANARANRGVRAPMALNNTAKLQDELWRKGAFKGIKDKRGRELTYEQAVDGVEGGWTEQAMANAKTMKTSQPETVQQPSRPPSKPKVQQVQDPYTGMMVNLPYTTPEPEIGDSNLGNGYSTQTGSKYKVGNSFLNKFYLFGYDNSRHTEKARKKIQNWNQHLPGFAQIPEDWSQGYGGAVKFARGMLGRDRAANAANEYASLDLSNPEQRRKGQELLRIMQEDEPKWGLRAGSMERKQLAIRGRIDQNQLHSGYAQKYGTYTKNTEFTPKGYKEAYVLSDPDARKREQDFIREYVRTHEPTRRSANGDAYIYELKGGDPYAQHGEYSIVTDTLKNNPRSIDDWDFGFGPISSKHLPGMREVIVSDKP